MAKPKKGKKFTYNLDAVLKVREIREKQEQEKFQEAERKYLEEKKKEADIKNFQQEKYSELRNLMGTGSKISNFQQVLMRKSHLDIVKTQVEDQERAREEADQLKEDQRQQLIKAVKDKKIMEKDREKKQTAWKKFMDKEDVKFMDDISTIGFDRKRRDGR